MNPLLNGCHLQKVNLLNGYARYISNNAGEATLPKKIGDVRAAQVSRTFETKCIRYVLLTKSGNAIFIAGAFNY